MTHKGKTVLSVLAIFAFAFVTLFVSSVYNTAQSQQAAAVRGPFAIAPAGNDQLSVWRIDQATGRVSFCVRNTQSQDPQLLATRAPFCSGWSE